MTNDDDLESNLLISSLLKKTSGLHAGTRWTEQQRQAIHHFKLIYAAGRLVAVIVYCLSSDLNLLAITVYTEV